MKKEIPKNLKNDAKKISTRSNVFFMESNNFPKGRNHQLVVQDLKEEVLMYDLNTDKAFSLNETSAAIWYLCDGRNSVSDITRKLSKKLNRPVPEEIVWLALDQFKKDDLLSNGKEIPIEFDGLSRREVIRKIGFTTMIALPVIASVIAPSAAMAASGAVSCGTVGQSCTGAGSVGSCCMGTAFCSGSTCAACIPSQVALGPCLSPGSVCPSANYQCCTGNVRQGQCTQRIAGPGEDLRVNPPPLSIQCFCV